ncbi:MAG: hypothetical protein RSD14_01280 [Clostridia bacterium]
MNIAVICKKENIKICKVVDEFVIFSNEYTKAQIDKKCANYKFIANPTSKTSFSICVVFADSIKDIHECTLRYKNKGKLIIVTANMDTDNILECLKLTSCVCYMKNENIDILIKVKNYIKIKEQI